MKCSTKVVVKMVSVGMLALLGVGSGGAGRQARADEGTKTPMVLEEARSHVTGTINFVDRTNRNVKLVDDQGESRVIHVPDSMKGFDQLSQGERISVKYLGSIALALEPAGQEEETANKKESSKAAAGAAAEEASQSCAGRVALRANVVSVDEKADQLTVRGPGGQMKTVSVQDPKLQARLDGLHPGDIVNVTYSEDTAAKITPAPSSKK